MNPGPKSDENVEKSLNAIMQNYDGILEVNHEEARQRGLTGYLKNGKVCTFENPPADEHSVHLVERILGQVLRRNNQCTLHVLQSPKVLPTALLVVMISTILQ